MDDPKPFRVLYDYSDVPTLKRFALSNKRVRCALGPFGSGKSSACVMEIVRRANMQEPGPDGIRRSRWVVVRNCYDDQTEILTEKNGWRLFRDVEADDRIATLDGERLVYKKHEGIAVHPYKGEMIGFEGEGCDFLVTPDHKMWVSNRRTRRKVWGEFEVATAEECYGKQTVRVRRDVGEWDGIGLGLSPEVFEWLGLWFAEGSYGVYGKKYGRKDKARIILTQCKAVGVEYARGLFRKTGIQYVEHKREGGINFAVKVGAGPLEDRIHALVKDAGKARDKRIPEVIMQSPREHIKAFLFGMIMGDGYHTNGTTRITTGSKVMADQLQEMILKAGGVANVLKYDSTGRPVVIDGETRGHTNGPTYIITILTPKKYHPILKMYEKHTNHLKGWYKTTYDGDVYCVEMPLVPVYVRRNGKAFWCMRTYGMLKDTTIKTFHDWFPPKLFGEWRVTDHLYIITKLPGVHLEVLFRALDRPDQVSNLLSLEVTGAWFNEAREIPRTIIEAMDGRIGRYPSKRDGGASWYGTIMDSNPPDEDSYLYKMFEKVKPDDWEIFKQPSGLSAQAENTKHLPKNYYQNLAKGKDDMYVRVYVHGQYGYIVSGKPVFASFKDNVHVARNVLEPMKGIDVLIGMDFGLQPAVTIGQLTPIGQLRILDELASDGMGIRQFCENQLLPLLRKKYFGMNVMGYGDPSGLSRAPTDESTCFDILHSQDIGLSNVIEAPTNAIVPRVGAVEFYLNKMVMGEPAFILSPNCHFLRKAMNGAYHYDKDPKGSGDEYKAMPVKNFASHVADSAQYLALFVQDKETYDKQRRAFIAQLKQKPYRPASAEAGY